MLRFEMGTVSDSFLKSQNLQGPEGIMCDHLFNLNSVQVQEETLQDITRHYKNCTQTQLEYIYIYI